MNSNKTNEYSITINKDRNAISDVILGEVSKVFKVDKLDVNVTYELKKKGGIMNAKINTLSDEMINIEYQFKTEIYNKYYKFSNNKQATIVSYYETFDTNSFWQKANFWIVSKFSKKSHMRAINEQLNYIKNLCENYK